MADGGQVLPFGKLAVGGNHSAQTQFFCLCSGEPFQGAKPRKEDSMKKKVISNKESYERVGDLGEAQKKINAFIKKILKKAPF